MEPPYSLNLSVNFMACPLNSVFPEIDQQDSDLRNAVFWYYLDRQQSLNHPHNYLSCCQSLNKCVMFAGLASFV